MRILHTSDWHLGKTLEGFSRAAEHAAFLDELVDIAASVDLVLVSGDVFDVYNPPIEAEELFYDALARLADGGRRAVVVIAGNHDSPDRLTAPRPLSGSHGIFLLGRPGDVVRGGRLLSGSGPSVLKLDLPCGERAVLAALPYPSEPRLKTVLGDELNKTLRQRAYTDKVARVFADLSQHYEPGAVNLAMSHLFVRECSPSESERELLGDGYKVDAAALPAGAQYVALGHLHMAQNVRGAPTVARYSGAPLPFRMSERDYHHTHTVVEVAPGGQAQVEEIPVSAGRELVAWSATLDQVFKGVAAGLHDGAFIDLSVVSDEPLNHAQIARLRQLPRDFLRIRATLPEAADEVVDNGPDRRTLPVSDLFRAFYRDQRSEEPDDALVELFVELAGAALGTKGEEAA